MKKIISLALIIIGILCLVGCNFDTTTTNTNGTVANETSQKEIYNDEIVKVSFIKKQNSIVDGVFEFYLDVENKTDKSITVLLQDAYMNDTMFMVGSGVPCDILPHKTRTHGFTGKYEGTGITGADAIKKIGFSIGVYDENFTELLKTNPVEINF